MPYAEGLDQVPEDVLPSAEETNAAAEEVFSQQLPIYLNNTYDTRYDVKPEMVDHHARFIHAQFTRMVQGLGGVEVRWHARWPKDWWQAFRDRWFPKWWLKRHPVEYEVYEGSELVFKAVCPHLQTEEEGKHVRWLLEQQRKGD